jgi:hypothetical protein
LTQVHDFTSKERSLLLGHGCLFVLRLFVGRFLLCIHENVNDEEATVKTRLQVHATMLCPTPYGVAGVVSHPTITHTFCNSAAIKGGQHLVLHVN